MMPPAPTAAARGRCPTTAALPPRPRGAGCATGNAMLPSTLSLQHQSSSESEPALGALGDGAGGGLQLPRIPRFHDFSISISRFSGGGALQTDFRFTISISAFQFHISVGSGPAKPDPFHHFSISISHFSRDRNSNPRPHFDFSISISHCSGARTPQCRACLLKAALQFQGPLLQLHVLREMGSSMKHSHHPISEQPSDFRFQFCTAMDASAMCGPAPCARSPFARV